MDVRHLHYFSEVAKHGSFTRASEALHISQPSLSKMVKSLESELGVMLIDRSGKRLQLTDAGKIVYQQADGILSSLRDLSNSLYDLMHLQKGTIKIGLPPLIGTLFFPRIIKSFYTTYPEIQVKLIEYGAKKMQKILEIGEVDIGIALLPVDEQKFSTIPFVKERLQLAVHKSHPLSHRQSISLKELQDESFILFHEDFTMHELIYNECIKYGFTPKIAYTSSQWDLIGEMVAANLGITLFPYSICQKLNKEQISIIELEAEIPWDLALIVKKNRYISFATQAFIDHMKSITDIKRD
ncbi:LysR family transcriptional regulator [Bacillus sp. CGMCC 1.16541]|uniref:LysR family transcriptional regulator n=1 Tax=Bacillus sp. CGMCC 1.16541 TaxID=2185143 RepID=UPI000D737A0A|nr:LysR family transcriptional regulator [Bacillus sp. CGMCC 1.16541]